MTYVCMYVSLENKSRIISYSRGSVVNKQFFFEEFFLVCVVNLTQYRQIIIM
jgi:hypothetical protein